MAAQVGANPWVNMRQPTGLEAEFDQPPEEGSPWLRMGGLGMKKAGAFERSGRGFDQAMA